MPIKRAASRQVKATSRADATGDEQRRDDAAAPGGGADPDVTRPARGLFLLGLMLGGAVGAALALLHTPPSVDGTRREPAEGSDESSEPSDLSDDHTNSGPDAANDSPL